MIYFDTFKDQYILIHLIHLTFNDTYDSNINDIFDIF